MKKQIFPQVSEKLFFFETLQKIITKNINFVQNGHKSLFAALKECSIEYLIVNEHVRIDSELRYAEYLLTFGENDITPEVDRVLTELYLCFKNYSYQTLNVNIDSLNKKAKSENKEVIVSVKKAIAFIKQEVVDYRLFSCLDDIQKLTNLDHLIIEVSSIKKQCSEKNQLLEYYKGNIALYSLIKDYLQKVDDVNITDQSQKILLEELEQFFNKNPKSLGNLLKPTLDSLSEELKVEEKSSEQKISRLLTKARQIIFDYGFGAPQASMIKVPDLFSIPQDELLILSTYMDGLDLNIKTYYGQVFKAIESASECYKYKEISANIIETQHFKELLFTLAELKSKAMLKGRYHLWKPIIDSLEDNLIISKQRYNAFADSQVMKFKDTPNIFYSLFKLKLDMSVLNTYYELALERFSARSSNLDKITLKKDAWLAQKSLKSVENINKEFDYGLEKPSLIKDEDEHDLYDKFSNVLIILEQFKRTKFKDFENINIDQYLLNFDVRSVQDLLNKKLAYKALYQREIESDHAKLYEKLYSQWIEINVLYGEGFSICMLESRVKIIDDLLFQIRQNFLKEPMSDLCDKTSIEFSQLYIKCHDEKLCLKIKQKIEKDTIKLKKLEEILQKKNLSEDDFKFIKSFEESIGNISAQKKNISSRYIDELEKNCQQQNPLFGTGQELEKLEQQLSGLKDKGDKKTSLLELTKILTRL